MASKVTSRASTPLPAIFGHFRPMLAQTQKLPWSSKRMFRGQYELVRRSLLRVGEARNACHRARADGSKIPLTPRREFAVRSALTNIPATV